MGRVSMGQQILVPSFGARTIFLKAWVLLSCPRTAKLTLTYLPASAPQMFVPLYYGWLETCSSVAIMQCIFHAFP
jgi:hypothetical protein